MIGTGSKKTIAFKIFDKAIYFNDVKLTNTLIPQIFTNQNPHIYSINLARETRSLLNAFKPFLERDFKLLNDSNLINKFVYESSTIFPEIMYDNKDIHSIAWGWSEVRVNSDIQWGYRLVYFVEQAMRTIDKEKRSVLILNNIEYIDRLSLLTLNHLLKNVPLNNTFFLLYEDLNADLNEHLILADNLHLKSSIGKIVRKFGDSLEYEIKENMKDDHNLSHTLMIKSTHDLEEFKVLLQCNNTDILLRNLYKSLEEYNLENVIFMAKKILNHYYNGNNLKSNEKKNFLFEVHRSLGLSYSFLEDYDRAINSFNSMLSLADTVDKSTRAYLLQALVFGKRKKEWGKAKTLCYQSLDNLKKNPSNDFYSAFEKSWIYNYLAFISYAIDKDFILAKKYVSYAYKSIYPYKEYHSEGNIMDEIGYPISSTRLMANLRANSAYLDFYMGNYQKSLKKWMKIESRFLKNIPEIFKKEHYYFEGQLNMYLKRYEKSETLLLKGLAISENYNDYHHEEIFHRKLAFLYYSMGNYQRGHSHYFKSLNLRDNLFKPQNLKLIYSLIITAYHWKGSRYAQELMISLIDQPSNRLDIKLLLEKPSDFIEKGPAILSEPFFIMNL